MSTTRWFPAIRGHERARAVLARAVERDRVPPTLLLVGHAGTGKALLARELAKAIECTGSKAVVPCGTCPACRRIDSGAYPDYVVLQPDEGKAVLGIDAIRAMLDELALAPVEGRKRIFVIDPADALSDDAQNALLKSLEEPPARAHLVLLALHEDALLRTIASRCFILSLGEVPKDDVKAILTASQTPANELDERAAWCGGSPGVALGEHFPARIQEARRVLESWASGVARRDPLGVATALLNGCAPKSVEAFARREGALECTELLGRALRDALDLAVRGAAATRLSGAEPGLLQRLASAGPDALARAVDAVVRAEDAIAKNQNVNLVLEGVVLDVAHFLSREAAARAQPVA